jgi:hypothetical protein
MSRETKTLLKTLWVKEVVPHAAWWEYWIR